ncbi:MAG: hypothetical protein EHM35_07325 [Planctomycetaceae bacterium]|nr:MAG: hypothetical protein EHM35_07325 [Planctomycetaceae bacterium]
MIIPRTKIWQACAKEADRPTLQAVHYNAQAKRLEAADGFILAVNPVLGANGDPDALLPAEAVKAAQKMAKSQDDPALQITEGGAAPGLVNRYKRESYGDPLPLVDGHYPDVNVIMPKESSVKFMVALDAALLKRLADAICENGSTGVRLYQEPGRLDGPILVKPVGDYLGREQNENLGVIMPVHSMVDADAYPAPASHYRNWRK